MEREKRASIFSTIITILIWGGLWGIFEATAGYLLHLLPISIGWLVWYSVACFFMMNVYRNTRRIEAVVLVSVLSACIKLLNLLLPVRIDRVINPAISIVFEALTFAAVIFVYNHLSVKKTFFTKVILVLCMNTGWRILYAAYLLFAPDWIRDISVISNANALIAFFLVHNILSGLLIFGGAVIIKYILCPIKILEHKLSTFLLLLPHKTAACIKTAGAVFLIGCSVALELSL